MVDTFSHGIWSYIIFNTSLDSWQLWLAIFFGMMPDLFSWTIYMFYSIFQKGKLSRPNLKSIPEWAFTLYGVTHSVFVFITTLIIVYACIGYIPVYLWAWIIHILIDIPTHSRKFLPTPFLWPLFDWKFPGVSWGTKWIFWLNWGLIFVFLLKMLIFG